MQYLGCIDLAEGTVRRAVLSLADREARSHDWNETPCKVLDSVLAPGKHLLLAYLVQWEMQNGLDSAPCVNAGSQMMMKILTVLSLLTFDMQQLKPKWLSVHLHFCRLLSVLAHVPVLQPFCVSPGRNDILCTGVILLSNKLATA